MKRTIVSLILFIIVLAVTIFGVYRNKDNTKEEDNTKDDNKDKDNEIELPVQDRENPLLWLLDKIIKFIVKLFKGRKK